MTTQHPRRRIVYVWDADYPWDVRTEKCCLALTQAGHDVHIVARNQKWSPEIEQLPEGTVHRMHAWRWAGKTLDTKLGFPAFFSPRWKSLLARTVQEIRAHLIIVRDLPLCPTAISTSRQYAIPVILDMAENYPAMMRDIWSTGRHRLLDTVVRNPRLVEVVEQYCINRVDHIFTVIEESSERLVKLGVPSTKLTIVSNTPSLRRLDSIAARTTRALSTPVDIVYLGLLEVARGINEIVDAAALLRNTTPRIRFRVIGSGRDAALFHARARQHGLTEAEIEFLGYLPYQEALRIVASADAGLIPHHATESWNTTIPNKLFDYMAAGLPVLSSDALPSARIVTSTRSGVTFRAGDAASLAAAARRLLDPDTRRAFGAAGRDAVLNRYNWEYDTHNLLTVIDTM